MTNLVHNSGTLMSPLMLGVKGEGTANLSMLTFSESRDCKPKNVLVLKEHNYLGFSDPSSLSSEGSAAPTMIKENKGSLNLKATELTLGPPGSESESPERGLGLNALSSETLGEKPLFPLHPPKDGVCSSSAKTIVSGNKRGFSDTIGQGKVSVGPAMNVGLPRGPSEQHAKANGTSHNKINGSNNSGITPAAKAQVVGWPPVRAFRKNTLTTTSKTNDEVDGKQSLGALFVKVSMDGAPYLRKVDLRSYSTYQELSSALQKMFSCFILGTYGVQEAPEKEIQSEIKLRDQKQGSEYVLTFEDKDGDWMLVGDVPWEMFIESCKRLKVMKGSDAIGLAPGAMEKSTNKI